MQAPSPSAARIRIAPEPIPWRPPLRFVPAAPQPQSPPAPSLVEYGTRRTLVVAGVMLAALLQTVDATIVNVALPTIQGNLGATVDEATWIVTAYVIANVIVIPLTPWLQARFGRKAYFLVSIAGFTAASVLCGLATSLPALIAFRIVQGAFGGGLLATSQVILRETFPPEMLGTSQSIFTLGVVLGPSIGPTLGGILTDNLAWQWVFDINVVPGTLAIVLLAAYLRESPIRSAAVDLPGIALLSAGVASLQYVLDQGQRDDWFSSQGICIAAVTAVAGLVAFVVWELRNAAPIVDVRLLGQRAVAAASLIVVCMSSGVYGILLLLPQFSVEQLGFTSTLAGMLIGIRALPIALLTIPIGRLANSRAIDLRVLVGLGLMLQGVSTFWLAARVTPNTDLIALALPLLLSGIGLALVWTPLLVALMRAVAPKDAPKASAFVTLSSQLGGSIFAALLVAVLDRRQALHLDTLAANVTLHSAAVRDFLQTHATAQLSQIVAAQSFSVAYEDVFRLIAAVLCAGIPLAVMLARKERPA